MNHQLYFFEFLIISSLLIYNSFNLVIFTVLDISTIGYFAQSSSFCYPLVPIKKQQPSFDCPLWVRGFSAVHFGISWRWKELLRFCCGSLSRQWCAFVDRWWAAERLGSLWRRERQLVWWRAWASWLGWGSRGGSCRRAGLRWRRCFLGCGRYCCACRCMKLHHSPVTCLVDSCSSWVHYYD